MNLLFIFVLHVEVKHEANETLIFLKFGPSKCLTIEEPNEVDFVDATSEFERDGVWGLDRVDQQDGLEGVKVEKRFEQQRLGVQKSFKLSGTSWR